MSKIPLRLGKVQLEIMQVLWEHGEATARQITDQLSQVKPIAHSTVQTLLRKMEVKGAVIHEIQDRTFVFRPLFRQSEVTETATRDLLSRLFDGSVYGLVSYLIQHETISDEEMSRLRTLIESEKKNEEGGAG